MTSLDPRHFDLMRSPDVGVAIAELWQKGFVAHGRTDLPPQPFALPFDWAQDPFADSNWVFQLQAWRMLDPYLQRIARAPAKAVDALADSLAIVADWVRAEAEGAAGPFAWYDMAVGIRAVKLALLAEGTRAAGNMPPEGLDLPALAERHMAELDDPARLSDNNHGLFQLHGLMALAAAFPEQPRAAERRAFAAQEMAGLIGRQFGPLGVHTENSPCYHFFALGRIEPMLDAPWWRLPEMAETHARLATARRAGLWLVDPAGRTPPIGDSSEGLRVRNFAGLRDWPHREQGGMLGAVLDGYGIVRSAPEAERKHAALLFLTASFQNRTHKHADCLSFVWQEGGKSILIDSGKYGYKRDVMRSYFVSSRAHNTVEIEGVRLSRTEPYGSGLQRVVPAGDLWLVEAEAARGALRHRRRLLYLPGRFVLAIDRVAPGDDAPEAEARKDRAVTSWWHFHPDLAIRGAEAAPPGAAAVARLEGLGDGATIEIVHLDNARARKIEVACGTRAPNLQGWVSRRYLKAEPAPVLGFAGRAPRDYVAATLLELVPGEAGPAFGLRWADSRTIVLSGPDLAADPLWPGGVLDLDGFALRLDPTDAESPPHPRPGPSRKRDIGMKLLTRLLTRNRTEDPMQAEEEPSPPDSVIAFDNPYAVELYARGYIARGDAPPKAPAGWRRLRFARLHLAHDPRLRAQVSTAGRAELLCLGLLFDVRDPHRSTETCQQILVDHLRKGETHFLSELAHMCGRFVCFYVDGKGGPFVVTDATGMKSAFYRPGGTPSISSHVELIARNEPAMPARSNLRFRYGYPGLRTTRDGVRLLTPNTRLDIAAGTPTRFWPTRSVVERDPDQAAESLIKSFNNAMAYVAWNHDPVVSVTAGLDSRATLSASLKYENVRYFTYSISAPSPSNKIDCAFNARLNTDGILQAEILSADDSAPDPDFAALLAENTMGPHARSLAHVYYKHFPRNQSILHIRSNIAETGQEFWRDLNFPISHPSDLARIYLSDAHVYLANVGKYSAKDAFTIIDNFTELDALTGLLDCAEFVDIKSLFYWEFKMASWHSLVVAESDPAFDSVSLFNCRSMLETMLSVSQRHRARGELQKRLIRANNPALAAYRINDKPFDAA